MTDDLSKLCDVNSNEHDVNHMDANLSKHKIFGHKLQNQSMKALKDVKYLTYIFA